MTKGIYNFWSLFVVPAIIIATTNATTKHPITTAIGIQRGAVTHHQDQVITFVSLRTRNTRNKRLRKLVPPTVTEYLLLI